MAWFGKSKKEKQAPVPEMPVQAQPPVQQETPAPQEPAVTGPSVNDIIEANQDRAGDLAITINNIRSLLGVQYLKGMSADDINGVQDLLEQIEQELTAPRDVLTDQSDLDEKLSQTLMGVKSLMELAQVTVSRLLEALAVMQKAVQCRFDSQRAEQGSLYAANAIAMVDIQSREIFRAETEQKLESFTDQLAALIAKGERRGGQFSSLNAHVTALDMDIENFNRDITQWQDLIENNNRLLKEYRLMSREVAGRMLKESEARFRSIYEEGLKLREENQKAEAEREVWWEELAEKVERTEYVASDNTVRRARELVDRIQQDRLEQTAAEAAAEAPEEALPNEN